MERWKPIKDYEGIYEVSSWGRVRSVDREKIQPSRWGHDIVKHYKGVVRTPIPHKDGYLVVSICGKNKLIHRLVAEAFIPNPNNLPIINHKDENPANNHVSNLEWCDCQYNNTYGTILERIIDKRGHKVLHIPTGMSYVSLREAYRNTHVAIKTIKKSKDWKVNPNPHYTR